MSVGQDLPLTRRVRSARGSQLDGPPSYTAGSYSDKEEAAGRERVGEAPGRFSFGPGDCWGRLVLKLRRRKHMASRAIVTRSYSRKGYGLQGEDLHIPDRPCPVCPVRPLVRE